MLTVPRFHTQTLKSWYKNPRRKPLVLRGARQIGKTRLVSDFAKEEGVTLFVLNLEQYAELVPLFTAFKPDRLLQELAIIFGLKIQEHSRPLLFIDEIQAIPEALGMLRYLYETYPQLPVIAAGSLLEFALTNASFSVPVGRIEYLHMGPVQFSEFVLASGEKKLLDYLDAFQWQGPFSPTVHEKLSYLYRIFLYVGGMPEATREYLMSGDLDQVTRIKASILTTLREDFAQYAKTTDLIRLRRVFDYLPHGIGKKIIFSKIDQASRAVDLGRCLELLTMARIAVLAFHTPCSGLPIKSQKNSAVFKPYFLDCGLVTHMTGILASEKERLHGARSLCEGALAEQFVAQHLQFQEQFYEEPSLLYWLREGKQSNAEVDFVAEQNGLIIPIEIKSGTSGTLKSLHQFVERHSSQYAIRFDSNPPSRQMVSHTVPGTRGTDQRKVHFNLLSLPLYAISHWRKWLDCLVVG